MSGFDIPTAVEWRRRAELAEYGEAIGLPTDHIVGVRANARRSVVTVLYTKTIEGSWEQIPVWGQTFVRWPDGVLHAYADPTIVVPSVARLIPGAFDD